MKNDYYDSSEDTMLTIARKYRRDDDEDVNMSLAWALESESSYERKIAIESLIAMNDLYAASNIYWMSVNGIDHARAAAVIVLGRLCNDSSVADHLMKLCLQEKCLRIRCSAAAALEIKGFPAVDALKKKGLLDLSDMNRE